VKIFAEIVRRITTFLLAVFLWLHALFLLNVQVPLVTGLSHYVRLTSSETILFVLLFLFSALSASGFLGTLRSIAYIYFFPLVLLFYLLVIVFRLLRAINRWFTKDQNLSAQQTDSGQIEVAAPQMEEIAPVASVAPDAGPKISSVLLRPFKRYTILWCILLLIATHTVIIWLSFIVVVCHLVWKIIGVLKITLFSRSWIEKAGNAFFVRLDIMLGTLRAVNARTRETKELEQLLREFGLWGKVARFLQNKNLVSRWAGLLVAVFFLSVYVYVALLFSFVYFGIGKVSGLNYPWLEAAITSLFIPAYIGELPKTLSMRAVGGVQYALIVCVGIGTFLNYLHRRLESVHSGAIVVSERLADKSVRDKLAILEKKFSEAKNKTKNKK
jgi:hypothetical protein